MSKPTIAIGIVNYNKFKFVALAINSALSQSVKADAIYIVDNNSTDGSQEIIQKTIKGQGIQYIPNKMNKGPAAAKNQIIAICKEDYIFWLDADDLAFKNAIEIFATAIAANPKIDGFYSDYDILANNQAIREWNHPFDFRLLTQKPYIHSNSCFRVETVRTVGSYNEAIWGGETYELCLRMAKSYLFHHSPNATFGYRIHESNFNILNQASVINNLNKIRQEILK